ncbi:hypothetical protein [Streptomyces sp. 2132.2]|uniref:hypothetical protein n=1 Tax=Streptomyces sp. 2132.2 TaxID=2485161 RepID=UPI0011CE9B6A|nr:hypothetical protein [Streptomyces sp. 2132.2]
MDGRADLYALGCVLAELLTGRLPFTGGELHALLAQHLPVLPAAPSGLRPGMPAALAEEEVRRLKDIAHASAAVPAAAAAGIPPRPLQTLPD